MSSLAEFIPIELVNHILSFRPRHPNAELIKQFKDMAFFWCNNGRFDYKELINMSFKEIQDYIDDTIFSHHITPNAIYKIKTKKYKNSEEFYWGKYYTELKARIAFKNYTENIVGDMYSIELVIICLCCNKEEVVETIFIDGSDSEEEEYESDDVWEYEEYQYEEDEIDYIEPELVEAKANLKIIKDY